MGRGKDISNSERRAAKEARREASRAIRANEDGAAIRIGQFGGNWRYLSVKQFAAGLGLQINFAGFWQISDSGKKVEGEDPASGYKFIMDSTRQYYRVQDAGGHYVDAEGRTIGDPEYGGDTVAFAAASHFSNRS